MNRTIALACLLLPALGGCADVQVHKISGDPCARDHVKGFRYYLPRPYVLVKQPVLLRTRSHLAILNPKEFLQQKEKASIPRLAGDDGVPLGGAAMTGKGAIEIVFLPDCEEEYAVQTRCVCGRCQMKLTFHDGWQLLGVNAKLDSTTFADGLLQTIDSAISQARTGAAPQPAAPKTPPVQGKGAEAPPEAAEVRAERLLVEITEHDIIPPGLYRVNKPWEMSKGRSADGGADLLTQLGLCPETIPSVTLIRALGPAAPLSTN